MLLTSLHAATAAVPWPVDEATVNWNSPLATSSGGRSGQAENFIRVFHP
jgi:hypothetical protein